MSPEWQSDFEALPTSEKGAVNEVCGQFERRLRQDPTARLESHLAQLPENLRHLAFRELLLLECEARARHGLAHSREELAGRFPGKNGQISEVLAQLGPGYETPEGADEGTEGATAPDLVPETLGRFEPKAVLGRGGFGIVYRAHDPRDGVDVALKVPHLQILLTSELRQRFLREADIARSLDHPNLARVVDVGEVGLLCYIATAFVPGTTLAAWLKERRDRDEVIPPATAARLIRTVAGAVQYAHERGILHCDIKPANILLCHGSEDKPLLTDFGLARLVGDPSELSRGSQLLGTPAYMAPEQATGRRLDVTARTDVYALGAVLYTLLAGQPPFTAGSAIQVLQRVLNDDPDSLRRQRPDVPISLEAICLKCLDKNPERRYPTAASLALDLDRFLDGLPTEARPPGIGRRLLTWARRRPTAAALAVAAALTFLCGIAALLYHDARLASLNADLTTALDERDEVNRQLADDKKQLADDKAQLADQERKLRRRIYPDQMRRIEALLDRNDTAEALRLLDEWRPTSGGEDLRGFDWHYLRHRIGLHQLACFSTGKEVSFSVTYTPDGRTLLAGERGGLLRVLDPESGRELCPPFRHPEDINQIVCSPDGRCLATACDDGKVRLWSLDGKLLRTWTGHNKKVHAIAFHPDGKSLVSAGHDGTGRLWRLDDSAGRVLLRESTPLYSVACSPDGQVFFGTNRVILVVKLPLVGAPAEVKADMSAVIACAFQPGGSNLITADRNGALAIWQALPAAAATERGATWRLRARAASRFATLSDLALSPDGRFAAVAPKGNVDIWSLEPLRLRWSFTGHEGRVWAACFRPDGRRLVTAGDDRTIRVWDFAAAAATHSPVIAEHPVVWLSLADDGQQLVLALFRRIELWRRTSHEPFARFACSAAILTECAVLLPGGRVLRTLEGTHNRARDWHLDAPRVGAHQKEANLIPVLISRDRDIAWRGHLLDPSGRLALGKLNTEGSVNLWHVTTGRVARTLSTPETVSTFAFGPSGLLAGGTTSGSKVYVWNTNDGSLLHTLPANADSIRFLAFSPSGRLLAGFSRDGMTTIWNLRAGKPLVRLSSNRSFHSAAFSLDDKTLATGAADGTIRLWQVATGLETIYLGSQDGPVNFLAFSRNGRFLASAADSSAHPGKAVVRVWDCGTAHGASAPP